MSMRKLIGYRGWKVWTSYDMHISLLALFYILLVDDLLRPFDSLILISSIGFYFMYGFLINDFFDIRYDIAAGKTRVIQKLSRNLFTGIILSVIFVSALHLLYLKEIYFTVVYILTYILGTLYSAPPVRFKDRGLSGIIVDGLIEKMLPVLAIFTFFGHFEADTIIFVIASLFIGIVDIMTHQIYDHGSDLKNGIHTFVVNMGIDKTLKIYWKFICPASGLAMLILSILISIKIQYAAFIAILIIITYTGVFLLVTKGIMKREEKIFPFYLSSLFFLVCTAFPLFLAFTISLKNYQNIFLLAMALLSQYIVIKSRLKFLDKRVIQHKDIFAER